MKTIELKKIISLLFILPIVACNDSFIQDDFWQGVNTKRKWEEQIHYAMTSKTRSGSSSLVLTSCEEKNTITSNVELEEAVELIFADDSYFAIQDYTDYSFVIVPIGEIDNKDAFTELKTELCAKANSLLAAGKNLRLLELEWVYKDSTYLSRAIVTDEDGILFETIGYLVLVNKKAENSAPIRRVKTRSEYTGSTDESTDEPIDNPENDSTEDPVSPSTPAEIDVFSLSKGESNGFGGEPISFSIYCSSTFNSEGVLIYKTTEAHSNAWLGFQCSAKIQTIKGDLDKDRFHEFAWGYHYGLGITANLSWNGVGFSVSGGGTSATGSQTHRKG